MNGVRRFLGGGGGSGTTTPTSTDPPTPSTPPQPATAPLFIPTKGPTWPPSGSSPSPPQTPADSPKTTTAALFFRRDKQKPPTSASSDDEARQYQNGVNGVNGRHSGHSSQFGSPRNSGSAVAGVGVNGSGSPTRSSPGAGPSSPRSAIPQRVSQLAHRRPGDRGSSGSTGDQWKRPSSMMMGSVRDDLLLSLLASEAIVDSRGYEMLSSEEVEELKKEQQVLQSRLEAMNKKLALETKIRDAALSLSKANASYKAASKQSPEQLDSANHKVDVAQKEVWKISERANEIQRRLLEHRASVLSHSVRSLEKKAAPSAGESDGDSSNITSGYSSPSRSIQMSPTPSSMTSVVSSPSKKFDGAHFFAGHSDAVVPRLPSSVPPTPAPPLPTVPSSLVTELEEKLKAAEAALQQANAKRSELSREVSMLQLEKEQIETTMSVEVQTAEDRIRSLEREVERVGDVDLQVRAFEEQREGWMRDRVELEDRRRQVEDLGKKLEALETTSVLAAGAAAEREQSRFEMEQGRIEMEKSLAEARRREQEFEDATIMWEADKAAWDVERETMMQELRMLQGRIQEIQGRMQEAAAGSDVHKAQLDACFDSLRSLVQGHGINLVSMDGSLPAYVASIGAHLDGLNLRLDTSIKAQEEWTAIRAKMEEDIRTSLDKREALYSELDQTRRERDEAKVEARNLQADLQAASLAAAASVATVSASSQPPVEYTGDSASIVAALKPLWAILPSPEARAGKMGSRFRMGSPTSSPVSAKPGTSLSELDVRSLKTLYDPKGMPSPSLSGSMASSAFTVEAFAERVQALVADDRALIERLIRFAQAHDLLKKNAERAQKLAQESNIALETYQKQVKALEERNRNLMTRQTASQDELHHLQETIDRISAEKLEIETQAAEQAETCAQLTDANNTLSARALMFAQEAASSTDHVRKQLEGQLAEANSALSKARTEIESVRQSQQTTQMAMMEELNSIQTENENLRAQLRAKK